MAQQLTILGLGLIGGSLGLALNRKERSFRIAGFDVALETIKEAVARGAVHWGTTCLKAAVENADLVILAVPVGQMKKMVQEMIPYLKSHCIISDVGSTKAGLSDEITRILPPHLHFVGGHPMTGSERAGISAAHPYLFENAIFVVTPGPASPPEAVWAVARVAELAGARVKIMFPEEHDQIVAGVSHLPHLVAVALVQAIDQLAQRFPSAPLLAAGGFRDTTRVAGGDPVLWRDISLANRGNIIEMIEIFQRYLDEIKANLETGNEKGLMEALRRARESRERIPVAYQGVLPEVHELLVTVPDRPGVLSLITGSLGEQGINIAEIEVLRVRENQEGTIRLAFQRKDFLDRAEEVLNSKGLKVKRR